MYIDAFAGKYSDVPKPAFLTTSMWIPYIASLIMSATTFSFTPKYNRITSGNLWTSYAPSPPSSSPRPFYSFTSRISSIYAILSVVYIPVTSPERPHFAYYPIPNSRDRQERFSIGKRECSQSFPPADNFSGRQTSSSLACSPKRSGRTAPKLLPYQFRNRWFLATLYDGVLPFGDICLDHHQSP